MSARLYAFPDARILRHSGPRSRSEVTLIQDGESLTWDTPEDYWAAVREADQELRRRLAEAGEALHQAAALQAEAERVLDKADRRARQRRLVAEILLACALAGSLAGAVVFACRP